MEVPTANDFRRTKNSEPVIPVSREAVLFLGTGLALWYPGLRWVYARHIHTSKIRDDL